MKTSLFVVLCVLYSATFVASAAPQGTTTITTDIYMKLERYAHFSSSAYLPSCTTIEGTAIVRNSFSVADTDTQGIIALDIPKKEIIVAFRGSTTMQDYMQDATFIPTPYPSSSCLACFVHSGFNSAWNSVKSIVVNEVRALRSAHPTFSVVVTGHSLGGAIAPFCALALKAAGISGVKVYSYGAPRVGDQRFANFVDSQLGVNNLFRSTHTTDSVPQLIPSQTGFRHHSTEYFIYADPSSLANVAKCSQEHSNCNNRHAVTFSSTVSLFTSDSAHHTYYNVGMGDTC